MPIALALPQATVSDCDPHVLEVTVSGLGAQDQSASIPFTRCDTTPELFGFESSDGATPGSVVISNAVPIKGIESPVAVAVYDGEYSIGCGATFTAVPGFIAPETNSLRATHGLAKLPGLGFDIAHCRRRVVWIQFDDEQRAAATPAAASPAAARPACSNCWSGCSPYSPASIPLVAAQSLRPCPGFIPPATKSAYGTRPRRTSVVSARQRSLSAACRLRSVRRRSPRLRGLRRGCKADHQVFVTASLHPVLWSIIYSIRARTGEAGKHAYNQAPMCRVPIAGIDRGRGVIGRSGQRGNSPPGRITAEYRSDRRLRHGDGRGRPGDRRSHGRRFRRQTRRRPAEHRHPSGCHPPRTPHRRSRSSSLSVPTMTRANPSTPL